MKALAAGLILSALPLTACSAQDGPVSPFTQPDVEWQLAELKGAAFEGSSTISFPEAGKVAGQALCNRFFGTADWSPESLRFGPLAMTLMACVEGGDEREITAALESVRAGEIIEGQLVLTLEDGTQMIYRPADG